MSSDKEKLLYSILSCSIGAISSILITNYMNKPIKMLTTKIMNRQNSFYGEQEKRNRLNHLQDEYCNLLKELQFLDQPTCNIKSPNHLLIDLNLKQFKSITSPLFGEQNDRKVSGGGFLKNENFLDMNSFVVKHSEYDTSIGINQSFSILRAGPRKDLYFNPNNVKAAIVTLGELVPGINSIIRGIAMSLFYNYEVNEIYGIKYSFKGLFEYGLQRITVEWAKNQHQKGGSVLGISKEQFCATTIVKKLQENQINQLYVIADYDDHFLLNQIYEEIKNNNLEIAICGIAKSKDNNLPISDPSIGFETQIEGALKAIDSVKTLCNSEENAIGIVKLVGQNTGFNCCEASLATGEVNVVLVPEIAFELFGDNGLLKYVHEFVKKNQYIVIVVAEGAGKALQDFSIKNDQDIGEFLKKKIQEYYRDQDSDQIKINYLDSSDQIRSYEANSLDQKLGTALAQNSTHGLMAGFTNFTTIKINGKTVYVPIKEIICDKHTGKISPQDRMWQRLMCKTQQPTFINDKKQYQ